MLTYLRSLLTIPNTRMLLWGTACAAIAVAFTVFVSQPAGQQQAVNWVGYSIIAASVCGLMSFIDPASKCFIPPKCADDEKNAPK